MRALADPWRRSVALAVALVAAGFVAILIAWVGVSATLSIPAQVSFAVSGGMGGFALAGAGLALFDIQRRRYDAAADRRDLVAFVDELSELAELVAARQVPTLPTARRRRALRAR